MSMEVNSNPEAEGAVSQVDKLKEIVKGTSDRRVTYDRLKDFAGAFAGQASDNEDFKGGLTNEDKGAFKDALKYMVVMGKGLQPVDNDINSIISRGISQEEYDKIANASDRGSLSPNEQNNAFYVDVKRSVVPLLRASQSSPSLRQAEGDFNSLKQSLGGETKK